MLSLKTGIQNIYEDGSVVTIKDITDEQTEWVENPPGSGNYEEVPASSKFYGDGGNPLRSDLANFLFVIKKDVDNDKDRVIYKDNPDPVNAMSWPVGTKGKDGYYRAVLIGVPIYIEMSMVEEGSYVYNNGSVYLAKETTATPPSVNSNVWEEITNVLLIKGKEGVYTNETDFGITRNSEICIWEKVTDSIKKDGCKPCKKNNDFCEMDFYLNAANMAFCAGMFIEGEKAIRLLDNFCKC